MDNYNFEWQQTLREALMERDPDRLRDRVAEAEAAVFLRLQDLGQAQGSFAERRALHEATETLLALKRDALKFPDWKT
jgi:hypothetical protein